MSSDGKIACTVSAILSIAVLCALGLFFSYPIVWWWGMHEIYSDMTRKFEFHGKVVDNESRPISEVTIGAELYTYSLFRGRHYQKFALLTDRDGRFTIGPGKGISLKLHPIEKSGYEVRGRVWPKDGGRYWPFNFSSTSYEDVIATQSTPFTFVMDPIGEP